MAALLAAICYLNTIPNQFVFDDLDQVAHNPLVTQPASAGAIFKSHYWQHVTPAGKLYRPLVVLSYALNHAVSGPSPAGYHLANLLLHAVCAGLVVLLGARLGLGNGSSLAAGLLFATHPIHTEAVASVVGRAELMAAAAVLAAWVIHLSSPRPGAGRAAAIATLFAAGLLSKENAVVLPALMLLTDLRRLRLGETFLRNLAWPYAGCAAALSAWLALRAVVLTPVEPGSISDSLFAGVPALYRICTALDVVSRYLWLLVYPAKLSADYSFQQIPLVTSWLHPSTLGAALILTVTVCVGLMRLAGGRTDGLPAPAFVAAVAPVSNILIPIGTIMGERLLYLPSVAFCLALPIVWRSFVPDSIRRRRGVAVALLGLLTMAYAARTIARNADWRDQLTLFSATTASSPRSAKAHYNLAVALEEAGRDEAALREYEAAIAILPEDAKSHHNAGLILARLDRIEEAIRHFEEAAHLAPGLPGLLGNLGVAYTRSGRAREAEAAFRSALERSPASHEVLYNLGTLLITEGRSGEAIAPLARARELNPSDPDGRYHLGLAYLQSGRAREALDELRAALALSPELHESELQIARAFLSLGERGEAARHASRARELGLPLPPELRELPGVVP